MNKSISSKELWNKASVTGLILGAVTIALIVLAGLCPKTGAGMAISMLLGIVKIFACIMVFRTFLKILKEEYPGATRRDLNAYGIRIAVCSALIVAGYSLLDTLVIHPGQIQEVMEIFRTNPLLDSNTMNALESIENVFPAYSFFVNLIYCFLWGWILSTIFAGTLAPSDPFGDINDDAPETDEKESNN